MLAALMFVLLGVAQAQADEAKLYLRFCVKPRNSKQLLAKGTDISLRADLMLLGDSTVMRGGQAGAKVTVYTDLKVKKGDWQCSTVRVGEDRVMTPFVVALASAHKASDVARAADVRGEWDGMTAYPDGRVWITFNTLEAKKEVECSQSKCEIRLYTLLDTSAQAPRKIIKDYLIGGKSSGMAAKAGACLSLIGACAYLAVSKAFT